MQVRVLGPIDVVADAAWRPVSGPRRKAILAVLALHGGEVVNSEKLADVVWGDQPPATVRNTLQRHLSYLRGVLGNRMAIVARPPGYLLDPGAAGTDLEAARRLIREGAKVADRAHEEQLREALALWRGRALADVDDLPWLREQAEHLERLRLQGVRALAQTRLALGEHERLVPELEALSRDNPFDEQLHGQLMLALYRSGRQADALTAYRSLREVLRDDLAIDPGPQLRDLQAAILRQDQALDVASDTAWAASASPPAGPTTAQRAPGTPRAVPPGSPSSLGTPLLEREGQLASMREFAAQAQGGTGRLVLIGGEAGVGKSMLVERLQQELPGARWSWGGCDGLFTPRPLGSLFDLAGQLGGALRERCAAGADRDELFRALLSQVSEPGELNVVVVEDIHWADEATLDLLRYLGRRLRTAPVLLIISYRDDELAAADPLRVALGDLAALRWTRRVELAPLSAHAVEVLAEGSGLAAADLFRLTGGNPFYVSEVLKAGTAQVPLSARDAVLARAARLGDGARELLDTAALAGSRVEVRMLEAVTRCEPAALDELVASGLMAADGGWLRFRHEIARLAVARAVTAPRAQAIHERMLATLANAGGEDDARLAFHAEQAGDDAATVRYAAAAARQAAQLGAHREAAAQFERALRFAGGADRSVLAALHDGFAQEAALLDRWQEAARAQERALALWRQAGDPLREGEALWRLSRIRQNMCRGREALAAARAAVSVLEALSPGVELARAYATYASLQMLSGDYDAAAGLSARAGQLAIRLGIMDVHSDALNTQAMSYAAMGLDWTAQLNRALEIALSGGHHSQAARAYCHLSSNHLEARDFAQAEPYLAEGIAYCDEHDITAYGRCLRGERSTLLEVTGRWDEAVELCLQLLPQTERSPVNRLATLTRLAVIKARRGQPGAWEYLDEADIIAASSANPNLRASTQLARAEAYWLEGRMDAARREAELAHETSRSSGPWGRGAAAAWLRRTGSRLPVSDDIAEPYRLLVTGDVAKAAASWSRLGCPYDAAMAMIDTADAAHLDRALQIAVGLGARPLTQLITRRTNSSSSGTGRRLAEACG